MNTAFRLFADCVLVSGHSSFALYDLGRGNIIELDIEIGLIFKTLTDNVVSIEEVLSKNESRREGINLYINYFVENELAFKYNIVDIIKFTQLDLSYDSVFDIDTLVVDISAVNIEWMPKLILELSDYRIRELILRFAPMSQNEVATTIRLINELNIRSIELYVPYMSEKFNMSVVSWVHKYKVYRSVNFYSSPYRRSEQKVHYFSNSLLFDLPPLHSRSEISSNRKLFIENHSFLAYLNKSIAVSLGGDIKNCASHTLSYGNISSTHIMEIYKSEKFRNQWSTTRDEILGCSGCIYRYGCLYESEIVRNLQGDLELLQPCGYNPFTNKWNSDEN